MKYIVVGLVLAVLTSISGSQPIPKTGWTVINEQVVSSDSYPRIAAFSNGDYVVVYGTSISLTSRLIALKIYTADGSVKVPETIISPGLGSYYAPNVIVVNDIAVVMWKNVFGTGIHGCQCYSNGTMVLSAYFQSISSASYNTVDPPGLFMVDDVTFGVTVSAANVSSPPPVIFYYHINESTPFSSVTISQAADIPTVIYDPRQNLSITFVQEFYPYYAISVNAGKEAKLMLGASVTTNTFTHTVPFLTDYRDAMGFITNSNQPHAIRLGIFNTTTVVLTTASGLMFDPSTTRGLRPDALHLGSNYALIAHSTTNYSVAYRYVRVNQDSYDLIGPVMNEAPMSSDGVSMAKVGKNIVMTAYDTKQQHVMTRVLTFCGNGVLDFDEQCDSSSGCSADCSCQSGTVAQKGLCLDVCGNGVVTGNEDCDGSVGCNPSTCKCQTGYQPNVIQKQCQLVPTDFVPKVGPSLDCLIINSDDTLELFFSFVSSDTFDQTIPFGLLNNFIPTELATDRPTFFATGTSLTYPVSPYNLNVSRTMTQFSWLLGSYNLTVDLSGDKPNALQCPRNAGFVITVATFDTLNDADVQTIIVNIAHKYNISIDRLDATYRLSTAGSVTEPNIYSISVTILASMNSSDPSAQDIVKELFSDLKDGKQQLSSELTSGLNEKSPVIKDVTPTPTGVEVRGQHRDIPTDGTVEPPATSEAPTLLNQFYLGTRANVKRFLAFLLRNVSKRRSF